MVLESIAYKRDEESSFRYLCSKTAVTYIKIFLECGTGRLILEGRSVRSSSPQKWGLKGGMLLQKVLHACTACCGVVGALIRIQS
jgi:hypothetical protein